jgi:hypothetical protein
MSTAPAVATPAEPALPPKPDPIAEAMARIANRTPEEVLAAREAIFAASRLPRPLPPGKTLEDVVCGQWPGDETDEEIRVLIRKIS